MSVISLISMTSLTGSSHYNSPHLQSDSLPHPLIVERNQYLSYTLSHQQILRNSVLVKMTSVCKMEILDFRLKMRAAKYSLTTFSRELSIQFL